MNSDLDKERWGVRWLALTMAPDKKVRNVHVHEVMKGGLAITYPHSLSIGSQLNIELHINFREKKNRIRAKTQVTSCQLKANGEALIDLKITKASSEEIHLLNNVLMAFVNSDQIDLKKIRGL